MKKKCKNCERIKLILEKLLNNEKNILSNLQEVMKEIDDMMMKCPVNQISRFRLLYETYMKKETYVKDVIKELNEILKFHNKK